MFKQKGTFIGAFLFGFVSCQNHLPCLKIKQRFSNFMPNPINIFCSLKNKLPYERSIICRRIRQGT
jgi:hypothetical protein